MPPCHARRRQIIAKAPGISGVSFGAQRAWDLQDWTSAGLEVLEDSPYLFLVRTTGPAQSDHFRMAVSLD